MQAKKIEKVCKKMGLENYRYRGRFNSRFLCFFVRNYLIFTRSAAETAQTAEGSAIAENGPLYAEEKQEVNRRGLANIIIGAVAAALELIFVFVTYRLMIQESGGTPSVFQFIMPIFILYYIALICSIVGLVRARKSQLSKGLRVGLPVATIVLCHVTPVLSAFLFIL